MSTVRCPVCDRVIAGDAQRCGACGTDLGDWDTHPSPLQPSAPTYSSGALWLDDLAVPKRTSTETDPSKSAPQLSEDKVQPPRSSSDAELRSALKTARRAEVRRARRQDFSTYTAFSSADSEVLVVDPDPGSRAQLCSVLGAFGFDVLAVGDATAVPFLAASRDFAAAFVDIDTSAVDGGDGIDLCKQFRGEAQRAGTMVLVLVVAQLRPVDRVRAELAGCDETILRPVTRGIVARVLDARGIVLPSDARRT
jgi:CheY-like chemotaxis protein